MIGFYLQKLPKILDFEDFLEKSCLSPAGQKTRRSTVLKSRSRAVLRMESGGDGGSVGGAAAQEGSPMCLQLAAPSVPGSSAPESSGSETSGSGSGSESESAASGSGDSESEKLVPRPNQTNLFDRTTTKSS